MVSRAKYPKGLFDDGAVSVMKFAALCGIHQSYVRKLLRCGTVRFTRVGRRVLIPRKEVSRLLEARLA